MYYESFYLYRYFIYIDLSAESVLFIYFQNN